MYKYNSPINFFIIYAANFFFSAAYFIILPVIPVYVNNMQAGVLGVIPVVITYFLAIIIAAPIIGYMADWLGRLRFAIGGALASAFLCFAYPFLTAMAPLLLVRILHGTAIAAFSVGTLTILADATENSWRGAIISSYLTPQLFWITFGGAMSLFLLPFGGAKTVFELAAFSAFIASAFSAIISRPKLLALRRQEIRLKDFLAFDSVLILLAVFIFYAVYSALLTNLESYLPKIQGDVFGGFFIWFAIAGIIVLYNSGNLCDRIGRGYATLVGFGFLTVAVSLVLLADKKAFTAIAGAFFGISYAIILPALTVWWMDISPVTKRGFFMGVFYAFQSAGMLIGLWILNIFGLGGPRGVFAAALVFVLAVFFALGFRQWDDLKGKFKK